jgi:hypothetical protein
MNRMETYRFGATIALDALRVNRVQGEREREDVYMEYSHQAHPYREMFDCLRFDTFVSCQRELSSEEQAAFTIAMNKSLREFRYNFERALQEEMHKNGKV